MIEQIKAVRVTRVRIESAGWDQSLLYGAFCTLIVFATAPVTAPFVDLLKGYDA